ncbi:MAG: DUF2461 domain-containing protein [Gammaproteobacteria bacterium]
MKTTFPGFPKDLFDFLMALKRNNNREWFNANKDRYKASVVAPVTDFIIAMAPRLNKISRHYVADPRANGGSMFRIYRDTRFSKDKSPYKTNVGCHFRHIAGKDAHAPGFYLHLAPGEIFFGGGVWKPPSSILEKIRETIADSPGEWRRIKANKTFIRRFEQIKGERLKRPPRGYDKDHVNIEDLKLKSFFVLQNADKALATSPAFINEVERALKSASPLMRFLTYSIDLPF